MYKKHKKQLKSFLNSNVYNDDLFSRNSMTTIIRALLEPVASQNAASIMFTRFKNKEGLEGLIKRLEYCNNVEMVDLLNSNLVIKDDYVELEFVVFTSARYNFVLIWDYSIDENKNYTKAFFLANSRSVNDVYEVLQENLNVDFREKFYLHKPERRENELLNEALFNVFKKLNNSIEENSYKSNDDFIIDMTEEVDYDEKIKEASHEIKNQLSIIDIYTKLLEKEFGKSNNLEIIKKSSSIIAFEINNLRNLEEANIEELNLQDVIETSINMLKGVLFSNKNEVEFRGLPYDIKVFADENRLLSVFGNIIKNANESTKSDKIVISLETSKNEAIISFENHGEKITESGHIFDKGYTTKKSGFGIGLFVCKKYIEEFKGKLRLVKSDEKETVFEISLPIN